MPLLHQLCSWCSLPPAPLLHYIHLVLGCFYVKKHVQAHTHVYVLSPELDLRLLQSGDSNSIHSMRCNARFGVLLNKCLYHTSLPAVHIIMPDTKQSCISHPHLPSHCVAISLGSFLEGATSLSCVPTVSSRL